jgi:hypothetical protein
VNFSLCLDFNFLGIGEKLKCELYGILRMNITNKSLPHLTNCIKLYLSSTNITDTGIKKLSKCKYLDVSYTKVTHNGIKHLLQCDEIVVSEEKIVKKLRKTHKNVRRCGY